MSRPKTVYVLRTQHENAGDLLINDLFLREIAKYADVEIDDEGVPSDFLDAMTMRHLPRVKANPKIKSVRDWRFFVQATLRKNPYRFLVLKPGDQNPKTRKARVSYALKATSYLWLAANGMKLVRIGTSFGRLVPSHQRLENRLSKKFGFMAVRDTLSNTDNNLNLPVLPDMAFLADPSYRATEPVPGRYAILSFRTDLYGQDLRAALDKTLDASMETLMSEPDRKVLFVAQVHRDAPGMKAAAERYGALYPGRVSFEEIGLDLPRALSLYRSAEIVISNRLHVALTTLVVGGFALAFVERRNDRKIWGLFQDAGWPELLVFFPEEEDPASKIPPFLQTERKKEVLAKVGEDVAQKRRELQDAIAKVFRS